MKRLDPRAGEQEVLAAVKEWVRLLADGRYQDACEYLYPGEQSWSPDKLKLIISNYGSQTPHWSGKKFKVTYLEWTPEEEARLEPMVLWRTDAPPEEDPDRGSVKYDLPLNGEWSQLSAIFNLFVVDGALVLELEDIEVL